MMATRGSEGNDTACLDLPCIPQQSFEFSDFVSSVDGVGGIIVFDP